MLLLNLLFFVSSSFVLSGLMFKMYTYLKLILVLTSQVIALSFINGAKSWICGAYVVCEIGTDFMVHQLKLVLLFHLFFRWTSFVKVNVSHLTIELIPHSASPFKLSIIVILWKPSETFLCHFKLVLTPNCYTSLDTLQTPSIAGYSSKSSWNVNDQEFLVNVHKTISNVSLSLPTTAAVFSGVFQENTGCEGTCHCRLGAKS